MTDVKSFDAGAFGYFANQYQFEQTKFTRQLGCSNASQAVIRWERTVLCSMWVNEQWSAQCLAFYSEFRLFHSCLDDVISMSISN